MYFLAGIFCLFFLTENWKAEFVCFLLYVVIVILGFLFKAYAFGDVEIYIALYPYFMKFFFVENSIEERFIQVISWYILTLFVTVVTSISIKGFKFNKTKALAPVIAFVFATVMCVQHFL